MFITLWSSPVEGWTVLSRVSTFHPIKMLKKFPSFLMKRLVKLLRFTPAIFSNEVLRPQFINVCNMIEFLSLASRSDYSNVLDKARAYHSEAPFRYSTLNMLLALPATIRLSWKGSLPYFELWALGLMLLNKLQSIITHQIGIFYLVE
jgi:hypothetical protein